MSEAIKTTTMILSFPSLTKPRSVAGGAPKFQATLVACDETDMEPIKAAFLAAGQEFFGDKLPGLLKKASFKRALKKDEDGERYPKGTYYIGAYSPENQKPQVVDRYADPATGKPRRMDDDEVLERCYAGSKGRGLIRFYGYNNGGSMGIACAINSWQWLADGPRLDNRVNAEDVFEAEAQDTADLPDPVEAEEAPKPAKTGKKAAAPKDGDLSDLL